MKSPIDTVKGRIVGYDERTGDVLIRARYEDYFTLCKREYKSCLVQLVDSRPLSDKQRKACYAMLGAISDYTGNTKDEEKTYMKMRFCVDEYTDMADQLFSLSNASMSLVCAFQRFLARFIVSKDIPCSFPLLDYVDDVQDYIYACLIAKKCCITGRPAQLHHVDRVGMGRDRTDILHEGLEALPLCPELHEEAHTMSDQEFFDKYHLPGGIVLDRTLCRIWHLKARKQHDKS